MKVSESHSAVLKLKCYHQVLSEVLIWYTEGEIYLQRPHHCIFLQASCQRYHFEKENYIHDIHIYVLTWYFRGFYSVLLTATWWQCKMSKLEYNLSLFWHDLIIHDSSIPLDKIKALLSSARNVESSVQGGSFLWCLNSGKYYSLFNTFHFQYFPPFCNILIQCYGLFITLCLSWVSAGAKDVKKQTWKWKNHFPLSFSSWLSRVLWLCGIWLLAETLWCGQSVILHVQQVNRKTYRLSGLCLHDGSMWPRWSPWSSRIWLTYVRERTSGCYPSPYLSRIPVDAHDLQIRTFSPSVSLLPSPQLLSRTMM